MLARAMSKCMAIDIVATAINVLNKRGRAHLYPQPISECPQIAAQIGPDLGVVCWGWHVSTRPGLYLHRVDMLAGTHQALRDTSCEINGFFPISLFKIADHQADPPAFGSHPLKVQTLHMPGPSVKAMATAYYFC